MNFFNFIVFLSVTWSMSDDNVDTVQVHVAASEQRNASHNGTRNASVFLNNQNATRTPHAIVLVDRVGKQVENYYTQKYNNDQELGICTHPITSKEECLKAAQILSLYEVINGKQQPITPTDTSWGPTGCWLQDGKYLHYNPTQTKKEDCSNYAVCLCKTGEKGNGDQCPSDTEDPEKRTYTGLSSPPNSRLNAAHSDQFVGWDTTGTPANQIRDTAMTMEFENLKTVSGIVLNVNYFKPGSRIEIATGINKANELFVGGFSVDYEVHQLNVDVSFALKTLGEKYTSVSAKYITIYSAGVKAYYGVQVCAHENSKTCNTFTCPTNQISVTRNAFSTNVTEAFCCRNKHCHDVECGQNQVYKPGMMNEEGDSASVCCAEKTDVCGDTDDWESNFKKCDMWGDPHYRNAFYTEGNFDFHAVGVFNLVVPKNANGDDAVTAQFFSCGFGNMTASHAVVVKEGASVTTYGAASSTTGEQWMSRDKCSRLSIKRYPWGNTYYQGAKFRVAEGIYGNGGICGKPAPIKVLLKKEIFFKDDEFKDLCNHCKSHGTSWPDACDNNDPPSPPPDVDPTPPINDSEICKICTDNKLDCEKGKFRCKTEVGEDDKNACLQDYCQSKNESDANNSTKNSGGEKKRNAGTKQCASLMIDGLQKWDTLAKQQDTMMDNCALITLDNAKNVSGLVFNVARKIPGAAVAVQIGEQEDDMPHIGGFSADYEIDKLGTPIGISLKQMGGKWSAKAQFIRVCGWGLATEVKVQECASDQNSPTCEQIVCESNHIPISNNVAFTNPDTGTCCRPTRCSDFECDEGSVHKKEKFNEDVKTTQQDIAQCCETKTKVCGDDDDWETNFSKCDMWGDPHYRNAFYTDGQFDFHAVGVFNLVVPKRPQDPNAVTAQFFACGFGNMTASHAVVVREGGKVTTYDDGLSTTGVEWMSEDKCSRLSIKKYNWGATYYQGAKFRVAPGVYSNEGICGKPAPTPVLVRKDIIFSSADLKKLCDHCNLYGTKKPDVCTQPHPPSPPPPVDPTPPVPPKTICDICTKNKLDCEKGKALCEKKTTEVTRNACLQDYCSSKNESDANNSTDNTGEEEKRDPHKTCDAFDIRESFEWDTTKKQRTDMKNSVYKIDLEQDQKIGGVVLEVIEKVEGASVEVEIGKDDTNMEIVGGFSVDYEVPDPDVNVNKQIGISLKTMGYDAGVRTGRFIKLYAYGLNAKIGVQTCSQSDVPTCKTWSCEAGSVPEAHNQFLTKRDQKTCCRAKRCYDVACTLYKKNDLNKEVNDDSKAEEQCCAEKANVCKFDDEAHIGNYLDAYAHKCYYTGDPHIENTFYSKGKFDFMAAGIYSLVDAKLPGTDDAFSAQMFACEVSEAGSNGIGLAIQFGKNKETMVYGSTENMDEKVTWTNPNGHCTRVEVAKKKHNELWYQSVQIFSVPGLYSNSGICGKPAPYKELVGSDIIFSDEQLATLCEVCKNTTKRPSVCDGKNAQPSKKMELAKTKEETCKICESNQLDCDKAKKACEKTDKTLVDECLVDYCAANNEQNANKAAENAMKEAQDNSDAKVDDAPQVQIQNPGFEDGIQPWLLGVQVARPAWMSSVPLNTHCMQIVYPSAPMSYYSPTAPKLDLTQGNTYKLSFVLASESSDCEVKVTLVLSDLQMRQIRCDGKKESTKEVQFKMISGSYTPGGFNILASSTTVWIDDLAITGPIPTVQ